MQLAVMKFRAISSTCDSKSVATVAPVAVPHPSLRSRSKGHHLNACHDPKSLTTRSNTMPSDIISSGMSSPQSSQSYQNIVGYHQFAKNGHPQARRDRINNPIYAGTPKGHNPSAHLPSPSQRANCHIKRTNIRQLEPMHIQIHY